MKMSCYTAIIENVQSFLSSSDDLSHIRVQKVSELQSAQQCVLILDIDPNSDEKKSRMKSTINQALENGQNRLVVRIWKGSARWWNLNSNVNDSSGKTPFPTPSPVQLAKSEVAGYRIAHRALRVYNDYERSNEFDSQSWRKTNVVIPQVLFFSHDNEPVGKECNISSVSYPWAIFSFVGKASIFFPTNQQNQCVRKHSDVSSYLPERTSKENKAPILQIENGEYKINSFHDDFQIESVGTDENLQYYLVNGNIRRDYWILDECFARDMVKIRHEFGFDEPHPRHGRVPVELSLTYAINILNSFILPFHSAFYLAFNKSKSCSTNQTTSWIIEDDEIKNDLRSTSWHTPCLKELGNENDITNFAEDTSSCPCRYQDMILVYDYAIMKLEEKIQHTTNGFDLELTEAISTLRQCLTTLNDEAISRYEESLILSECSNNVPAVICHMDLQPQNMMLLKMKYAIDDKLLSQSKISCLTVPQVASVLDWEEACYADPRFELLLICRKVVANRKQADCIWDHYSKVMKQRFDINIGPLEPWLKLETVHSLLTLLMQSTNLVGGGRSPWEQKPDLKGKIEREFSRLAEMGWQFCAKGQTS